jgi:hypothetical protein
MLMVSLGKVGNFRSQGRQDGQELGFVTLFDRFALLQPLFNLVKKILNHFLPPLFAFITNIPRTSPPHS